MDFQSYLTNKISEKYPKSKIFVTSFHPFLEYGGESPYFTNAYQVPRIEFERYLIGSFLSIPINKYFCLYLDNLRQKSLNNHILMYIINGLLSTPFDYIFPDLFCSFVSYNICEAFQSSFFYVFDAYRKCRPTATYSFDFYLTYVMKSSFSYPNSYFSVTPITFYLYDSDFIISGYLNRLYGKTNDLDVIADFFQIDKKTLINLFCDIYSILYLILKSSRVKIVNKTITLNFSNYEAIVPASEINGFVYKYNHLEYVFVDYNTYVSFKNEQISFDSHNVIVFCYDYTANVYRFYSSYYKNSVVYFNISLLSRDGDCSLSFKDCLGYKESDIPVLLFPNPRKFSSEPYSLLNSDDGFFNLVYFDENNTIFRLLLSCTSSLVSIYLIDRFLKFNNNSLFRYFNKHSVHTSSNRIEKTYNFSIYNCISKIDVYVYKNKTLIQNILNYCVKEFFSSVIPFLHIFSYIFLVSSFSEEIFKVNKTNNFVNDEVNDFYYNTIFRLFFDEVFSFLLKSRYGYTFDIDNFLSFVQSCIYEKGFNAFGLLIPNTISSKQFTKNVSLRKQMEGFFSYLVGSYMYMSSYYGNVPIKNIYSNLSFYDKNNLRDICV